MSGKRKEITKLRFQVKGLETNFAFFRAHSIGLSKKINAEISHLKSIIADRAIEKLKMDD